ncbi:MAG: SAM-dependent chlorinase/fluorinase [Phycisphaerae bacterium]|nr:SAM-dependent chlorinase/fluorinase [Phycisphaerae bacterium]
MAKHALVTLLTDFGTRDPYVAAMKGVILRMCPKARIVDISHDIPPQDILAGAFVLAQAAPHYPPDTLHVVVIDPGVGTERRIMAGRFGEQLFLFPDNGVITFVVQSMPLKTMAVVRNAQYLPAAELSMTFHGRDIFAPLAGHVLNGVDIARLGPSPKTYKLLDLPAPQERDDGLIGQVVYVDGFGNLISNISRRFVEEACEALDRLHVICAGRDIGPLQGTYGFVGKGEPLALFNSMDLVEVAVNGSKACEVLGISIGAEVRLVEN